MKKLLILSGKGGTGKTTTAAAFIDFIKARAFADCDVDAPNLHLVAKLAGSPRISDYYGSQKAGIDPDKCIGCGACYDHCHFQAIEKNGSVYQVNEFACEGCGVCAFVCPVRAVTLTDDVSGVQRLYAGAKVFSTAQLKMGRGNSGTGFRSQSFCLSMLGNRAGDNRRISRGRLPRDRVSNGRRPGADRIGAISFWLQRSEKNCRYGTDPECADSRLCQQA